MHVLLLVAKVSGGKFSRMKEFYFSETFLRQSFAVTNFIIVTLPLVKL